MTSDLTTMKDIILYVCALKIRQALDLDLIQSANFFLATRLSVFARICYSPVVIKILCKKFSCQAQGLVDVMLSHHFVEVHGYFLVVKSSVHDGISVLKQACDANKHQKWVAVPKFSGLGQAIAQNGRSCIIRRIVAAPIHVSNVVMVKRIVETVFFHN